MLKIKHAINDPQSMSQDGDSILKSLQNIKMPIIDLVVRESIQNSLDAALNNKEYVKFDFYHGNFQNKDLALYLKEIDKILLEEYKEIEKFLAFSDRNTSGLTGSYIARTNEEIQKSNFHKLIFGIGKNQEQEGSGGSWGLGKTSFFRIGNGIVIYYSRIKSGQDFEDRLIVSLIESPKNDKRFLKNNERGIAWWGQYGSNNHIIPITDYKTIEKILNIFGLKTYGKDESGTMTIIPYISNNYQIKSDDESGYYWYDDLDSQLKLAIQRWYMPRLFNNMYSQIIGQPYLMASVNKQAIVPGSNTEEIFNVFRALYDSALTGKISKNNLYNIKVSEIKFPRLITLKSNDLAGRVAFCQLDKQTLKMLPPYNQENALALIGVKDPTITEQFNSKIMAYARQPGMVVRYAIDDDWMPKSNIQDDSTLLLGCYVPVSSVKLHSKFKPQGFKTMESYLRAIETADHSLWEDQDGINIVLRTKRETSKLIQESYNQEEDTRQGNETSGLARKYGALFVPLRQGSRSLTKKDKKSLKEKPTFTNRGRPSFSMKKIELIKNNVLLISLNFTLPALTDSTLSLRIQSSDRQITYDDWKSIIGNSIGFPFEINNLSVEGDISYKVENDKVILRNLTDNRMDLEGVLEINIFSNEYSPFLTISSRSL